MIHDEIIAQIASAGLRLDAGVLARWADSEKVSREDMETLLPFSRLLSSSKSESTRQALLKLSRLPSVSLKTFDNFDFSRFDQDAQKAIRGLTSLSFLPQGRNVVLVGDTGTGKTHIARAIGYEACSLGIKTYFMSFHELNCRLTQARHKGMVMSLERTLRSQKCLIIDEVGKDRLDAENTEVFFNLLESRAASRSPGSLVLTSNTKPEFWKDFFTSDETTEALLDRILDHVEYFSLSGDSYRGRDRNIHLLKTGAVPLTVTER